MSLKTKNILRVMSIVSVVLLALVGVTYRSTTVLVEKTISDHQLSYASDRVEATELWLEQQMRILEATAQSIPYQALGQNRATLAPLQMAMKAGHFSDVYIGLTDGRIIDGAGWVPPDDYDPRVRPWYQRAEGFGKTTFTTPYVDLTTMELVIALVTPLVHEGRFVGVMAADTVLDTLTATLLDSKVGESGYLFVALKDGTILIHPERGYVMKAKLHSIEPGLWNIRDTFRGSDSGTVHYLREQQEHVLSYKQIKGTDWFLCTSIPMNEAYRLSRKSTLLFAAEIGLRVLGGLALLILVGVGGSAVILVVSSRRFQSTINQQITEISGINEDLRWNINRREEVESRYQTLFNVANDAILISKGDHFIECNNKASELFGTRRHNLIGRNIADLFPEIQPDGQKSVDKARLIVERAARGEQQYYEWNFKRLDGSEFPAEVGLKQLQIDSQTLVMISIRDVSKRVFAERQLLQTQKLAAMGEMLGAIAHQWRQPLNILSTYVTSLQSAYYNKKIDKEYVETLVVNADNQIQFMSKTIDDFRHFFKPSKRKHAFDISDSLSHAIKLVEPRLKQGGVELQVIPGKSPERLVIYGYQSEIVHVIVNILANAQEAIEERFRRENGTSDRLIRIDMGRDGERVVLQIQDSGGGIPGQFLPQIFSPNFTTKGPASGTGIGLYMAKIIVEREMGGTLTAENRDGGALFTISLPYLDNKGESDA